MLKVWDGKSKTRQNDKFAAPDAADWDHLVRVFTNTQRVVIENNSIFSNIANEEILIGQPLILESNSQVKLAETNINPEIVGLCIVDCKIGENCIYITQGRLILKNWQNVTNSEKLTPGACYFLSMQEKGKLTTVAPNTSNTVIVQIGRAQNKEILSVNIDTPIYLT